VRYQVPDPVDPRDAFTVMPEVGSESTQPAAASQSALLLSARAGVLGVSEETKQWQREGKSELHLPDLGALQRTRRLTVDEATRPLGVSAKELESEPAPRVQGEMARTVDELYQHPSVEGAAALFEAAMYSPHPLVRVSAAAGARETTRLRKRIRATLETECESSDPLVARLAQTALAQIDPKDPEVTKLVIEQPKSEKRDRESNTSVITHGTFASDAAWYRPGGDFYTALAANRPDLDVHDESFTWTGAYSTAARRADALLLKQWIDDQGLVSPDFFAHSHGGTVAHHATKKDATFNRLVLMGWPVHKRWFPAFSKVQRIIDVRVNFDLVILLDRGGQRFRTNEFNIEEERHGWFDHSSTHEPEYWDQHDLWDKL
jgi:pimeloyl-ACP methyl ester carboxylesterase